MESIRERLSFVNEDMLFLDPEAFDEALIGYATRIGMSTVAAYDEDKIIEILIAEGLTEEEALEHFDYNILGSWVGEETPVFVTLLGNV